MHDLVYRKLLPSEKVKVREHFLRLEKEDRRLRFFGQVGDAFIESYCSEILVTDYAVLGCFVDGELRAVGELHSEAHLWNRAAEVAITVERPFQNLGIGTEILRQLIRMARNRSIETLHLFCLLENTKMQKVARKAGGALKFAEGEVAARINPPWPTYWSLMDEALADGRAAFHIWSLARKHASPRAANDDPKPARKVTA
jgi:GNAT superfamily N-acetyltransferase